MGIIEVMNISEGEYCVADQPIIPEAREENQNAVSRLASDPFHITIGKISILFVPSCTFCCCQLLSSFVNYSFLCARYGFATDSEIDQDMERCFADAQYDVNIGKWISYCSLVCPAHGEMAC